MSSTNDPNYEPRAQVNELERCRFVACLRSRLVFPLGGRHCRQGSRRRGSGIVRGLIVACATLAILVVCFSIYQNSEFGTVAPAINQARRFPEPPTTLPKIETNITPGDGKGFAVGGAVVGAARNVRVSLYPREGTDAIAELAVADWTPVDGSPNKLKLASPEIRLTTKDGHAVRATADEGTLEGHRRGAGFNPERGNLSGNVVIEYDRFSREERARLPEELRSKIDPSQIMRIETDQIDFDREFMKLVIPGKLRVSSPIDVDFTASDLEVRFDEHGTRVESLRLAGGGRLELRGPIDQFGVPIPRVESSAPQRLTIVDWLRTTLQARLEAKTSIDTPRANPEPLPALTIDKDGVPVFNLAAKPSKQPKPAIRYLARFERNVDAKQLQGESIVAQLLADSLEIERELAEEDQKKVRASPPPSGQATSADKLAAAPTERIVLAWSGLLTVSTAAAPESTHAPRARAIVTAHGAPVRLSNRDGEVSCDTLVYKPDLGSTLLTGSTERPVIVRSADVGTLSGPQMQTEVSGDSTLIRVKGPAELLRPRELVASSEPIKGTQVATSASIPSPLHKQTESVATSPVMEFSSKIEFVDQLEAVVRTTKFTKVDLRGGISTLEKRLLERASFSGKVRLSEDDTALEADALDVSFAQNRTFGDAQQSIEQVNARGHVTMTRGSDRLTGNELVAQMSTDANGKTVPVSMTVTGDVTATQESRSIRARDKLIADFDHASVPNRSLKPDNNRSSDFAIRRIRAFNDVRVVDSAQSLDLTAAELDATISAEQSIETAILKGSRESPAFVQLEDYSVSGVEIKLDAINDRAEVPGEGRMTFRSLKDLDGRRVDQPIPIVITWNDRLKYQGRENRATFSGMVHATSETATTFDCDELVIEFEDVAIADKPAKSKQDWWILQKVVDAVHPDKSDSPVRLTNDGRSKQPARLIAAGRAIALTSETDPKSGELRGRARLAGPRLLVDLRREISKMLIEGPGSLLLEDFRPVSPGSENTQSPNSGLFGMDETAGLSKTLIQWKHAMSYDFSFAQARFDGAVDLRHFSGEELARVTDISRWSREKLPPGRATFLLTDVLIVDFLERAARSQPVKDSRMNRLSAQRLEQFQAMGNVTLQDQRSTTRTTLTADDVVYEKDRDLLSVHGARDRKAHVITQKPGQLPSDNAFDRAFYHIATGRLEVAKPMSSGQ